MRNYKRKTAPAPWKLAQELAGHTKSPPAPQTPVPGKPAHGASPIKRIPRVSKKRKERGLWAKYPEFARMVVRKARAGGKRCPVVTSIPELINGRKFGRPISSKITECHHCFGHGHEDQLLLWEPGCIGVSKEGHRWIHSHIEEARQRGWYAPNGLWNNAEKVLGIWQRIGEDKTFLDRMLNASGYHDEHNRR